KPSVCGGFDVVDVQLEQGRHQGQPAYQLEREWRGIKAEAVKNVEALALEAGGLLSIHEGLSCECRQAIEASEERPAPPRLPLQYHDAFAQGFGESACSTSACSEQRRDDHGHCVPAR